MSPFLLITFDQTAIFKPFLAMMLLTLAVWLFMYARRISYMVANRIDAQQVSSPEKMAAAMSDAVNRPANNLKNLFELPVLFYAVCLAAFALNHVDMTDIRLAWAFVGLRALHSLVHCTVNIVKLRFAFYLLSSLALWTMIVRLALAVA